MNTITLSFLGNISLGDARFNFGSGVRSVIEQTGYDFVPSEIVTHLQSRDGVICNLECVLSRQGEHTGSLRKMVLRGKPEYTTLLSVWGITLANLANNHILEQGITAAIDTAENLKSEGVEVFGAGKDFTAGLQCKTVIINQIPLHFIGICLVDGAAAFNGGGTLAAAKELIKSLDNGVKILSIHWGDVSSARPSLVQREIAAAFQELGVALIIGHHPCLFQGIQFNGKQLTAYGLGNFIYNRLYQDTDWSVILDVTISAAGVEAYTCRPIVRNENHQPYLITEKQALDYFLGEIEKRNSYIMQPQWDAPEIYAAQLKNSMADYQENIKKAQTDSLSHMPLRQRIQMAWHKISGC